MICISGGVSPELPLVLEASNAEYPFQRCPNLHGNGSLPHDRHYRICRKNHHNNPGRRIAQRQSNPAQVWIGGNIGTPLITFIDEIKHRDDLVILELSSFQLELMSNSPDIAAILNITPNHLDRHGTMDAYKAAKARILGFPKTSNDTAILCRDDPGSGALRNAGKRRSDQLLVGTSIGSNSMGLLEEWNDYLAGKGKIYLLIPVKMILPYAETIMC